MSEESGPIPEEELPDAVVEEMREFLDLENKIVQNEHTFFDRIQSWNQTIAYFYDFMPEDDPRYELVADIGVQIQEIEEFIQAELSAEIQIMKEEEKMMEQIGEMRHHDWKLAKALIKEEVKKEEQALRVTKDELKKLHKLVIEVAKTIKRSEHMKIPEEHLTKGKKDFEDKFEYYLVQLYKFILAYERILRDLWEKERVILGEIKGKL